MGKHPGALGLPVAWGSGTVHTRIRIATREDAAAVLAIYAPFVRETGVSFEYEPPSVDQMRARIVDSLVERPWLVCERGDQVLGYAYATHHRSRIAYQWTVETSVYVSPSHHRCGVGRGLYHALLPILKLLGYWNALAGITLPNAASVGLHESLGFKPIGVYPAVGYKFGVWHDVGWWSLRLRDDAEPPRPLTAFSTCHGHADMDAALSIGARHVCA